MSKPSLRAVSIVVIVLVLLPALIIGLSTPASALFLDWGWLFGGDGSDTWLPPDEASGMGLSDEEYVSLWGGVSIYAEDSSQYDAYESEYKSRFGEGDALNQFHAMALGIVSPEIPGDQYLRWNDRAHRLSYSAGDPTHGNVEDSYLISDAFIEIIRTDPHAYYDPGSSSWWSSSSGSEVKYIGKDAKLSFVSDERISSRPTERRGRGLGSTRTRYRIVDRDRLVEVTAKNSAGGVVDQSTTRSSARSISLDLSSMESGDEVQFEVVKEIDAVEEETHYERVCTNWDTRYRFNSDNERTSYRVCTSSTWEEYASYTNEDSVTVEDSSSAVIYDPTVSVSYTSQTKTETFVEQDFYYVDVESDQPIAGFKLPDGGFVSYPYGHTTTRDREYDAALGELTPIKHHVASFGSEPTVSSTVDGELYSFDGETRFYRGSSNYEFAETEARITNVDSVRVGGTVKEFDAASVNMYPIIPGVDVNTDFEEESNLNLAESELKTRYEQVGDDEYTVHIELRDAESGDPITTAGEDDLSISIDHSASNDVVFVDSDSNGEAKHTFTADQGDVFHTTFNQSFESRSGADQIYLDSRDLLEIRLPIDSTTTLMNILGESVWAILFVFGPGVLLLSAIYYSFTGKVHPF